MQDRVAARTGRRAVLATAAHVVLLYLALLAVMIGGGVLDAVGQAAWPGQKGWLLVAWWSLCLAIALLLLHRWGALAAEAGAVYVFMLSAAFAACFFAFFLTEALTGRAGPAEVTGGAPGGPWPDRVPWVLAVFFGGCTAVALAVVACTAPRPAHRRHRAA